MSVRPPRGSLALLLHTHMPYVEGFGTWPFGEEWLFEAAATCYLPLLDVLDEAPGRVTLSVTPVLADQLEAEGVTARLRDFLTGLRAETHRRDLAAAAPETRSALRHSRAGYEAAAEALDARGGDLAGALMGHATWTSSATHAVLPLCATTAGVRLQVETGIAAHRARTAPRRWEGGFWLPECAHAAWLDPLLEQAGVHATCVDLTDVLGGAGDPRHLRALRTPDGPLLVPIDRATLELVWGERGYPAHGAYRDYHRHTEYQHRAWANDGAPYDPARARAQAEADAADFVARAAARVADGGLAVCALDTELLGHWWYEGPTWLAAVLAEADRAGLTVAPLDDALAEAGASPAPEAVLQRPTSWGTPRDLTTWSGPQVGDLARSARDAELRVVAAGAGASDLALRELLALQSSDWAFLETRGTAGPYARERAAGHRAALDAALAGGGDARGDRVRNLAAHLVRGAMLAP